MTKTRDEYTWDDAARDLALATRLTLSDAGTVTRALEGATHPFDAIPPLVRLFASGSTIQAQATALKDLVTKTPCADGDEA